MKALVLVGLLAGCYREYGPGPVAPMGNIQPDPVAVAGPPGGAADPGYGYDQPSSQDPTMPGYNAGYPEGYPAAAEAGAPADPYATEPAAGAGDAMGTVDDAQIDATLAPYGEWIYSEEYGRVWRPYATVVGASFTPYETCGSWVYTDYGWTYNCDFDWGWLPFHYGQWDWFEGGWGWVPDYTWGPGWVDWRYGSDYVGWRPTRPHRGRETVRDHRGARPYGQAVLDWRRSRESDWRFVPQHTLGKHIRGNLVSATTALPLTRQVSRVPVRGSTTVAASTLLSRNGVRFGGRSNPYNPTSSRTPYNPTPSRPAYRGQRDPFPRSFDNRVYPRGVQQPRYDNRGAYQPPRGNYQPSRGNYQPSRTDRQPYQPSRGTYQPSRGTYQPSTPSRTYSPPSTPSRTYSPPSTPSRTYSPPSRPSSSSSSSSSRGSSSSSSSSRGSSSSSSSSSRGSSSSSSSSRGSSSSSSSGGSRGRK